MICSRSAGRFDQSIDKLIEANLTSLPITVPPSTQSIKPNKKWNKSITYNLLNLYFYNFLLVYFIINDKYADHQSSAGPDLKLNFGVYEADAKERRKPLNIESKITAYFRRNINNASSDT